MPDERFDWLVEKYKPKSVVPANLTVYDIAGLTRGSSTGAGLGNAFLSHIRAVDAIFQVVRCFDDAEIIHVEGDVNPVRDLEIIAEELRLKDIEFVEKALENQKKKTRMGGQSLELKKAKIEQEMIEKVLAHLQDGKDIRKGVWTPKEVRNFSFVSVFCPVSDTLSILLFHDDKRLRPDLIPALRYASPYTTLRVHSVINFTLNSNILFQSFRTLPLLDNVTNESVV